MTKSDQLDQLATALSQAQGEILNATKDSSNPFFKSTYADLASVREAIQPVFTKYGLSYAQTFSRDEHGVIVETVLMHKSGQWLCGGLSIKPVKDDPQGIGSAITYARRYSLQAIAGIAADDDDGEAAMGREKKTERKEKTTPPATQPTSTPTALPHPSVVALKPGEKCTIERVFAGYAEPAKGKTLGAVTFQDDPTKYGCECDPALKRGEKCTVTVECHDANGKLWYEITEATPF